MSQNVSFLKLKVFDDKLIKSLQTESLRATLPSLFNNCSNDSDKQSLFFEDIDVKFLISAYTPSIQILLENKKLLFTLDDEEYYWVNQELWELIENEIWNQILESLNSIQQIDGEDFDKQKPKIKQISNYHRDLEKLKQYYENNQLILEVP